VAWIGGKFARRSGVAIIVLLALLVVLRLIAPFVIKSYVNRVLDRNPDYDGRVDDVDIHLWRGAYSIDGVKLIKTEGENRVPLLDLTRADLSVEWKQLIHGAVVAEIRLDKPILNLVAAPQKVDQQTGTGQDWTETVKALTPIDINRFQIVDGRVHYLDPHGEPPVDIEAEKIYVDARNLTNSEKLGGTLVSQISAQALVMKSGAVSAQVALDPFAKNPTFKMDGRLENLNLTTINEFLRHYAGLDVQNGTFSVYTEATAKDGGFQGYAKPFIKNLNVLELKSEKKPLGKKVKEGMIDIVYQLFKNDRKQSLATRVEFSGSFDNPAIPVWSAIRTVLHHAFIHALQPSLDNPRVGNGATR
jgi:hypothetical protein